MFMMKNKDKLREKILQIIRNSDIPVTTRNIALITGRAWRTVMIECLRLKQENKLTEFKAGHAYLWSLKK